MRLRARQPVFEIMTNASFFFAAVTHLPFLPTRFLGLTCWLSKQSYSIQLSSGSLFKQYNSRQTMGMVFGKTGAAEPAFEVLYQRTGGGAVTSYEIRKYGTRFAAEAAYAGSGDNAPFNTLARYIGVFGKPENEGATAIAMTAPVVRNEGRGGTQIAMTAPVVRTDAGQEKTMAFVLPEEYDSIEKIPKPTNPNVHIREIPSAKGAVHRWSGSMREEACKEKAIQLAKQLRQDGCESCTDEYVLDKYQFWGYHPPFTLPMFRRNEVWVELTEEQVKHLVTPVAAES
jgi:hypothetical protein